MEVVLPTTASHLGALAQAEIIGDAEAPVHRLCALNDAGEGSLSFHSDIKYSNLLEKTSRAVIFCRSEAIPKLQASQKANNTYLVVADPKRAFSEVARAVFRRAERSGIDPSAKVHASAKLADTVFVGPHTVIEAEAQIGPQTQIDAFCYIGSGVKVGSHCTLFPRVSLMEGVTLGDRVKIFPGAVIGSDGFGLFQEDVGMGEIPQIGRVVIEDEVRIGANCTIDRAMLGETRIGKGTKIDDQVHVGHNCIIGKYCILCAQVGLAGSVVLEDQVVVGGQVGIKDHVKIGKGVRLGAQSGVLRDLAPNQDYWLTPALPLFKALRVVRCLEMLPQLFSRVSKLEKPK